MRILDAKAKQTRRAIEQFPREYQDVENRTLLYTGLQLLPGSPRCAVAFAIGTNRAIGTDGNGFHSSKQNSERS
jgi:hypothetical protein